MARKLFHQVDNISIKNSDRYKDFRKPLFDSHALRLIGKAIDQGIIKEEVA